jgi:hypothetical protein
MVTKGKIYGCSAYLLEGFGQDKKNPAMRLDF